MAIRDAMRPTSSVRRTGRGSFSIGAGLGLLVMGVQTWYAVPVCQQTSQLVETCVVSPIYLLAALFLIVGAVLIGLGSISLVRGWRSANSRSRLATSAGD
jgi:hypothetical protein